MSRFAHLKLYRAATVVETYFLGTEAEDDNIPHYLSEELDISRFDELVVEELDVDRARHVATEWTGLLYGEHEGDVSIGDWVEAQTEPSRDRFTLEMFGDPEVKPKRFDFWCYTLVVDGVEYIAGIAVEKEDAMRMLRDFLLREPAHPYDAVNCRGISLEEYKSMSFITALERAAAEGKG